MRPLQITKYARLHEMQLFFCGKGRKKIICTYWTKMLYSLCFLAVELYTKKMAINFLLFWQQDNLGKLYKKIARLDIME